MKKKRLLLCSLLLVILASEGCATIRGMGEDIQSLGRAVKRAVSEQGEILNAESLVNSRTPFMIYPSGFTLQQAGCDAKNASLRCVSRAFMQLSKLRLPLALIQVESRFLWVLVHSILRGDSSDRDYCTSTAVANIAFNQTCEPLTSRLVSLVLLSSSLGYRTQ